MIERYDPRPRWGRSGPTTHRLTTMLRVEEELLKALAPTKGIPASELKVLKRLMEKSLLEASRKKRGPPATRSSA